MGSDGLLAGKFPDQALNAGAELRALAAPVVDPVHGHLEFGLLGGCHRVEKTNPLDEIAVATTAGVGCDHVKEGTLMCAAPGKSDDDHAGFSACLA